MISKPKCTRPLFKSPLMCVIAVFMGLVLFPVLTPAPARAEQLPEDSYVYVESSEVSQGDVQRIALVFGTGRQVFSANLFYQVGASPTRCPRQPSPRIRRLLSFRPWC